MVNQVDEDAVNIAAMRRTRSVERLAMLEKQGTVNILDAATSELSGIGLKAKCVDDGEVELLWGTNDEEDNKGFVVEKKLVGRSEWEEVASYSSWSPLKSKARSAALQLRLQTKIIVGAAAVLGVGFLAAGALLDPIRGGVRAVRTLRRKASPESLELLEQLETLLEDRSRLDKFSADAFGPSVLDLEDYDEGLRSDDPDDLEVVLDRARAAQDALDAFCLAAAAAAGLGPEAYERARRKGFGRAADKVRADYDGDAQRLRDGARGSLVAETEGDLARLLRTLMRSNGDTERVVRCANRFRRPPFTGYRDALFTARPRRAAVAPAATSLNNLAEALAGDDPGAAAALSSGPAPSGRRGEDLEFATASSNLARCLDDGGRGDAAARRRGARSPRSSAPWATAGRPSRRATTRSA
ncbi:hypothetical protein JL721_11267 [Aureococcus anophagefferens]|nr:hypothetical protein JL721_11267 [Aureococcus anophagefferens]